MTRKEEVFQLKPTTRILTPDAPEPSLLQRALSEQASLRSSPIADTPLQTYPGQPQRLFCESAGSSGTPKLIRRTPTSWRASFAVNEEKFAITPQDNYAVLGHLGHSLSFYATLEAMHIGTGLAFLARLSPKQQARALRGHEITTLYATPSQLRLIVRTDPETFPKVTKIFFGGGKMDKGLRTLLMTRFPEATLTEFFGASETSFVSISDDQTPEGSVGSPYPGVKLRIGDGLGAGKTGEIWVKSPYLFDGYEAGDSPLTVWRDGYLSIGELGWRDEAGHLYLQGRRSRMVTVADQNVFPEAIETLLLSQPGVEAAAVITPNDPLRGAQIVAAIVGQPDIPKLRQACRAELGSSAVPRKIWELSEMPMLPAGKPDLKKLESLWQEQAT